MGVEIIFKIAGIGIIIAVVAQILKQAGKEEIATLCTLSGLIVELRVVIEMRTEGGSSVQNLFYLY